MTDFVLLVTEFEKSYNVLIKQNSSFQKLVQLVQLFWLRKVSRLCGSDGMSPDIHYEGRRPSNTSTKSGDFAELVQLFWSGFQKFVQLVQFVAEHLIFTPWKSQFQTTRCTALH